MRYLPSSLPVTSPQLRTSPGRAICYRPIRPRVRPSVPNLTPRWEIALLSTPTYRLLPSPEWLSRRRSDYIQRFPCTFGRRSTLTRSGRTPCPLALPSRSEERRVGKEGSCGRRGG